MKEKEKQPFLRLFGFVRAGRMKHTAFTNYRTPRAYIIKIKVKCSM
jgi:hypothetical protein